MDLTNNLRGMLVGLAMGDALGAPVEFMDRDSFPPVTNYQDGGPHRLKAGQWTDDTSMALCTAASLIHCGKMDADDQLTRYLRWYRDGYMSSTGVCFDIGNQTRKELELFELRGSFSQLSALRELQVDNGRAGNGALMRLAPVVIKYHDDLAQALNAAELNSQLTHMDQRCVDANKVLAYFMIKSLDGPSKNELLRPSGITAVLGRLHPDVSSIVGGSYKVLQRSDVQSTGYVIHSLEAALWAFYNSDSFEEGVRLAVNLGGDTDTIGAIYGQLAGAYWGYDAIPHNWVKDLYQYEKIVLMADLLNQGLSEEYLEILSETVEIPLPPSQAEIMRTKAYQSGIANRYCWNDLTEMPRDHAVIEMSIKLAQKNFNAVKKGLIPDDMGEKMFMYFEEGRLFMHRSSDGQCAYVVDFEETTAIKAHINMSIVNKHVTLEMMKNDLPGWIRALITRNLEDNTFADDGFFAW